MFWVLIQSQLKLSIDVGFHSSITGFKESYDTGNDIWVSEA
ncbi:hypothetical protein DSM03_1011084 [Leeuwenhoekiella aestuarii]|nr:hypothetical protein DSM03_1011084 [Leeuwenhoekiella aestuarii]